MADTKGNKQTGTPAAGSAGAGSAGTSATADKPKRARSSPAEARKNLVKRVRDGVGKAVAQLQSAEIRRTGKLSGNAELVSAYEAFDAQLEKLGAANDTPAPAAAQQA